MTESVYKVIELVGTSTESWEKAATAAVEKASKSVRNLRIAEIIQLDMQIEEGKMRAFRAKVKVSFKFEDQVPVQGYDPVIWNAKMLKDWDETLVGGNNLYKEQGDSNSVGAQLAGAAWTARLFFSHKIPRPVP